MPTLRQTSFASGELDPLLWGRTDLPAWPHGARRVRNLFISPQGAAVSRPGSTAVAALPASAAPRLIPFLGPNDASYVLQFGHLYVRAYSRGAVSSALIATPYTAAELGQLKWAQQGATMTLTHPNHPPMELSGPNGALALKAARLTPYLPAWRDVGSDLPPVGQTLGGTTSPFMAALTGTQGYSGQQGYVNTSGDLQAVLYVAGATYNPGDLVYCMVAGDARAQQATIGIYSCVQGGKSSSGAGANGPGVGYDATGNQLPLSQLPLTVVDTAGGTPIIWHLVSIIARPMGIQASSSAAPAGTSTALVPQNWQWLVTMMVKNNATGEETETLPQLVTTQFNGVHRWVNAPQGTVPQTYVWTDMSAPGFDASQNWGGQAPMMFTRDGVDLAHDPAPVVVDSSGEWVAVAFNFYRRLGPTGAPGYVGTTTTRQFVDPGGTPDTSRAPPSAPAFLAIADHPSAVAYFQQRRFLAGWSIGGSELVRASRIGDFFDFGTQQLVDTSGEPLEFTVVSQRLEEIRSLLPVQRQLIFTGAGVWSAGGSGMGGSPIDFNDLDVRLEDHEGATSLQPLVAGGRPVYVRARGVGVRALSAAGQEERYVGADLSTLSQHFFRGTSRQLVDWCYARDPWSLLWCVLADGTFLSGTFVGDGVSWARHDTDGQVLACCSVPEGDEDAVYFVVSRTIAGVSTLMLERLTSRVIRNPLTLGIDDDGDTIPAPPPTLVAGDFPDVACAVDCAVTYVGPPVTSLGADQLLNFAPVTLAALEGKQVWVVGRGLDPAGPFVVRGGQLCEVDTPVLLAQVYDSAPAPNYVDANGVPLLVVHVGLFFTPQLETLDVISGNQRLRRQVISRVGFEVDNSIGLQVGPTFVDDEMEEWDQRDVDKDGTGFISAATAVVDMQVKGSWMGGARACLEQSSPRPVTVVGISRVIASAEEE